ncbi:hypothetical protein [Methylocella sp.]|uniref:hypothetical protein n=1 Tax=Methylocella sp. TaxID=1978226 RepID=UPI0035AEF829
MSLRLTRRAALAGAAAMAAASAAFPWRAAAAPQPVGRTYGLRPVAIGEGVWIVYGANEPITPANGGAIANATILDTSEGAVVIDARIATASSSPRSSRI